MAVSVSVSSQVTSSKKVIWSWVVSEKNNKFGSLQTDSAIIGDLFAINSALESIPEHLDIVIRTRSKKVAEVLSDYHKETKNPLVNKVFQRIKWRSGRVQTVVVTQSTITDADKRALKMTMVVSNTKPTSNKKVVSSNPLLFPRKTTTKVRTTRKPKASREVLYTGLEDDYDVPVPKVIQPATSKPVLCDSCDGPINPLTFECFCSA